MVGYHAFVAAVAASACTYASLTSASVAKNITLPVVDLGYQRHQGSFNETGNFYRFDNIRYAAPPVNDLRFKFPQAPSTDRSILHTGEGEATCPQSYPTWASAAQVLAPLYLAGQRVFNETEFPTPSIDELAQSIAVPGSSEDCLFLDVIVPKKVFYSNTTHPVIVWIHGGGYISGSKNQFQPAGIVERSQRNGADGIIFVSINYRLGALGWTSGPALQSQNGTANLGLHDQRFALEWVQNNIHLFGGDPHNVTAMGESAGAGSIMYQIAAYGGLNGSVPFKRAIIQSPGFFPIQSSLTQDNAFASFLDALNVSTLAEANTKSSSEIQMANIRVVADVPFGTSGGFGPAVDGSFNPANPRQLLLNGQYDKNVEIMVGTNALEGVLFVPYYIQNNTAFENYVLSTFPVLGGYPDALSYCLDVLYPPTFDGSHGYNTQIERGVKFASDWLIYINSFSLSTAQNNHTHLYHFDVYPALHGSDLAYTFYNGGGQTTAGVSNVTIAYALQDYILAYVKTGNPNAVDLPDFPLYGPSAQALRVSSEGINEIQDPAANVRSSWFQKAFYM
ncbi:carboxylesterase family protein-like protein [Aureobasidium pullulans]|uniref:Carboxylesterase family protein-like protein n=1 Tax=Aureobasidium pullulans TaxID=5580 RepID=A0A4V4JPS3_AURPU|nr:carboxylesterase family protein-like protein [Aureobasidium pullulans]